MRPRRYTKDYYRTRAWYARCDAVRQRARGQCEFCRWRPMEQTHHRTYAHFGAEPLTDLMGVCDLCHRVIHGLTGFGRTARWHPTSLLARGDSGLGESALWLAYLRRHPAPSRGGRVRYAVSASG
jgi:hypothetical protein